MKTYKYTINGNKYEVAIGDIADNIATLTVNGEEFKVEMEKAPEPEKKKPVLGKVATTPSKGEETATPSKAASDKANSLKAPLPGVITDILVEVGQEVQAGENVIVLEAMKMANNLQTEKSGKVTAICVQVGQSVMEDEPLVVIE
jgi:biotin carboxyl carrier protein